MTDYITPYLKLEELVATLRQWEESKIDFVADSRHLQFTTSDGSLRMQPAPDSVVLTEWLSREGIALNSQAVADLAGRLDPPCPTAYLRAVLTGRPELAASIADQTKPPRRFFVRCLNGSVRAILSDQYRVIDHLDCAQWSLQACRDAGGVPLYATLTDRHMRLSITTAQVWDRIAQSERNVGTGSHHWVNFGRGTDEEPGWANPIVTVTNSETGDGGLGVSYGILIRRCVNTVIVEQAVRQIHLGSRMDLGLLRQDTAAAEATALRLRIRDAIAAGLHPATFARIVAAANRAQEQRIEDPRTAAGNVLKAAGVANGEEEIDSLMSYFLRDYDQTQWGLSQAVSRYAQDAEDGETVAALEVAAGAVVRGEL